MFLNKGVILSTLQSTVSFPERREMRGESVRIYLSMMVPSICRLPEETIREHDFGRVPKRPVYGLMVTSEKVREASSLTTKSVVVVKVAVFDVWKMNIFLKDT